MTIPPKPHPQSPEPRPKFAQSDPLPQAYRSQPSYLHLPNSVPSHSPSVRLGLGLEEAGCAVPFVWPSLELAISPASSACSALPNPATTSPNPFTNIHGTSIPSPVPAAQYSHPTAHSKLPYLAPRLPSTLFSVSNPTNPLHPSPEFAKTPMTTLSFPQDDELVHFCGTRVAPAVVEMRIIPAD
jgi:hypothetical protein